MIFGRVPQDQFDGVEAADANRILAEMYPYQSMHGASLPGRAMEGLNLGEGTAEISSTPNEREPGGPHRESNAITPEEMPQSPPSP